MEDRFGVYRQSKTTKQTELEKCCCQTSGVNEGQLFFAMGTFNIILSTDVKNFFRLVKNYFAYLVRKLEFFTQLWRVRIVELKIEMFDRDIS